MDDVAPPPATAVVPKPPHMAKDQMWDSLSVATVTTPYAKHAVNPWSSQCSDGSDMRKHLLFLTVLCAAGIAPVIARAQTQAPLTCADFQRNPNGSWSPVRAVTLNGVMMGPGVAFTPGVLFGGVDLATILNQQCR
jgi:hypothetical protein